MGADLYIDEIHKGHYHCYDGMSSVMRGYYRDSYNRTNLLWQLGMSYWRMYDDPKYRWNKDGNLTRQSLVRWRNEIKKNYKKKDWTDLGKRFDFEGGKEGESKQKWIEFFKRSYNELIVFINLALKKHYLIRFNT